MAKLWRGVVVCQGELDEGMVDATISVGDVKPSYSQGAFLLPG
jgi:hypothetical protein